MSNLNLNSNTVDSTNNFFASDAILVTRVSGVPGSFLQVTVYSGQGDLQENAGAIYYNAAGVAAQASAMLYISNTDPTVLPDINAGDTVTRVSDGRQFIAVSDSDRLAFLPHLEIMLKRGDIGWKQP